MKKNGLHTPLCDMLGIKYPIVLAGMGYAAGPALTAAVSNAGGLGVLGGACYTTDELRRMIKRTKNLTDKPFGVDVPIPPQLAELPPDSTEESLRAVIPSEAYAFVNKLGEEFGIPKARGRTGMQVFSTDYTRKCLDIAIEENVPVFVSAVGDPSWAIPDAHAHGMKMMSCIGLVRQARRLVANGVDVIIAQGTEAGGHTGRIGTMALVPQVVDAIAPTPVLAAGGIADGRGLVAALALGAIGAWIGTAFVVTEEAGRETVELGHMTQWEVDAWKKRLLKATEDDTMVSRAMTGKPLRFVRNKFVETYEKRGGPILKTPLQMILLTDLHEGMRQAHMEELITAIGMGGQISGMIKKIKPAAQLFDEIVEEASSILEKLSK